MVSRWPAAATQNRGVQESCLSQCGQISSLASRFAPSASNDRTVSVSPSWAALSKLRSRPVVSGGKSTPSAAPASRNCWAIIERPNTEANVSAVTSGQSSSAATFASAPNCRRVSTNLLRPVITATSSSPLNLFFSSSFGRASSKTLAASSWPVTTATPQGSMKESSVMFSPGEREASNTFTTSTWPSPTAQTRASSHPLAPLASSFWTSMASPRFAAENNSASKAS